MVVVGERNKSPITLRKEKGEEWNRGRKEGNEEKGICRTNVKLVPTFLRVRWLENLLGIAPPLAIAPTLFVGFLDIKNSVK